MNTKIPELKIVESIEEDFVIDFSFEPETKDYTLANQLKPSEIISPCFPTHNTINPFREGDVVVLSRDAKSRFQSIIGNPLELARISGNIGNFQCNISFWDSLPSTVKNVHIRDLTLAPINTFKTKVRYNFLSVVHFITPKWYLYRPISQIYKEFIDSREIKASSFFSKIVLKLDSIIRRKNG